MKLIWKQSITYYGENIESFDSADIFCEKQIQSDNEKISTVNSRNKKVANSPKQGIFFGRLVFRLNEWIMDLLLFMYIVSCRYEI